MGATVGFSTWCLRNPEQCVPRKGVEPTMDHLETVISNVNVKVNRSIRPQNEPGKEDIWKIRPSAGDCEDYAATKRDTLIRMGFGTSFVRFATARTDRGENHLVLVVTVNGNDYILDNLTDSIKPKGAVPYSWGDIQSSSNPLKWVNF